TRSCASARTRTRDFCEATGAFSPAPCSPHEPQYLPYTMINRVVLVTTYFRPIVGGVESNAERLAEYLSAAGVLVRVLTTRITRERPDSEEDDGVTVERIGPFGNRSSAGKWRLAPYVGGWLVRHSSSYDVVSCIDYRGVGLAALAARGLTGRPVLLQAQTARVLSGDHADAALKRLGINLTGRIARFIQRHVPRLHRLA